MLGLGRSTVILLGEIFFFFFFLGVKKNLDLLRVGCLV